MKSGALVMSTLIAGFASAAPPAVIEKSAGGIYLIIAPGSLERPDVAVKAAEDAAKHRCRTKHALVDLVDVPPSALKSMGYEKPMPGAAVITFRCEARPSNPLLDLPFTRNEQGKTESPVRLGTN
jgi:hypothetical protein